MEEHWIIILFNESCCVQFTYFKNIIINVYYAMLNLFITAVLIKV